MPLPEGYLPREGDEVLIRAKVRFMAAEGDETIFLTVKHQKISVPSADIHALYCRHWNVGDKVASDEFDNPGEVMAAHCDYAWVKTKYGIMCTVAANDLKPWVEPVVITGSESMVCAHDGILGSQSIVGDDDPIAARDEATNR